MSTPTSFVTMQKEIDVNSKKKTLIIFGTLAFLLAFTAMVKFTVDYWGKEEEIIDEVGVTLPETRYHDRNMMALPVCKEDQPTARDKVIVGYVDGDCNDVESCVGIVRHIADQANFFITIGHVFEGYGWKCNVTDMLTVKFIGNIDFGGILLFYLLMNEGMVVHEMRPTMTVQIDKTSCNKDACMLLTTLEDHRIL